MDKISIIIPAYNVQKYLNKCIESVIAQTYKKIEIILVDDGSTDESSKLCDIWASKDDRINVIHKKNGGLSEARNIGLDNSTGKFVMFIDSDDYIEPDMVALLYNRAINDNSQMVLCNFNYVDESYQYMKQLNLNLPLKDEIISKEEFLNRLVKDNKYWYYVVAWNKLYNRELFNDIRYPIGKLHEDEFIIQLIVDKCINISCVQNSLYNYLQRNNSIMGKKVNSRTIDGAEAFLLRANYLEENGMNELSAKCACLGIDIIIKCWLNLNLKDLTTKNNILSMINNYRKFLSKQNVYKISIKEKIKIWTFLLNINICILYVKIINKYIK